MAKMVRRNPYHCQAVAAASAGAIFHLNACSCSLPPLLALSSIWLPPFPMVSPDFPAAFPAFPPMIQTTAYDTCRLQWRPLYRPQGKAGAFYGESIRIRIRIKNHQPASDLNERLTDWLTDWLRRGRDRSVRVSEPFDCLIDARSNWLIDAFVGTWLLRCLANRFGTRVFLSTFLDFW